MNKFCSRIKNKDWTWVSRYDDSVLYPWIENDNSNAIIKSSPVRAVFTASDGNGNHYFIKHSFPRGFFNRLCYHLHHEFVIAEQLRQSQIPCAEAIAWGHSGSEEMLITQALENVVPLHVRLNNPETHESTINAIADAVAKLWKAGFLHNDCHTFNMLFDEKNGQVFFIDLAAISRRRWFTSESKSIRQILLKLFNVISLLPNDEQKCDFIIRCSFASDYKTARKYLEQTIKFRNDFYQKRHAKRIKKILNGEFFNSSIIDYNGHKAYVLHGPDGKPKIFNTDIPENLQTMPHENAEKYWPDAILSLDIPANEKPIAWIVGEDGMDTIVFNNRK